MVARRRMRSLPSGLLASFRRDHQVFWNIVRPIHDPFWDQHRPGDRWNCKCSLEATDEAPTAIPKGYELRGNGPQPGLNENPAKSGQLFAQSHPYFPQTCAQCPFYQGGIATGFKNQERDCNGCRFIPIPNEENNVITEATPELSVATDREAFNAARRGIKAEMLMREKVEIYSKRLYSHTLIYGNNQKRCILGHCFDQGELNAAQKLQDLIPTLRDGKYLPIDMSRRNYREKMERFGVRNFVAYNLDIDGITYVLKCEAKYHHGRIAEYPYSIKKERSQ